MELGGLGKEQVVIKVFHYVSSIFHLNIWDYGSFVDVCYSLCKSKRQLKQQQQ